VAVAAAGRRWTWRELAASQEGVLARYQWLALGETEAAWEWQLSAKRWRPVLAGVAVTHSGEPTDVQRAWAAVLHAGRGAALSGDAGLVQHRFRLGKLHAVDVAVPHSRQVEGAPLLGGPALVVHRVRRLDDWVHPVREPAVLKVAPAALHAAAWAQSDRAAEWRLAAVVQQKLTVVRDLRAALTQMRRLPRRALVATVLDDVELGAHAGSELDFLRFCRAFGVPEPDRLQVLVRAGGKRYLDGSYDRQRVALEVDGTHHMLVENWDADALRTLELVVAGRGSGTRLVRLTAGNLRHDADRVAALLRELLL
jgi:hypothetical protein